MSAKASYIYKKNTATMNNSKLVTPLKSWKDSHFNNNNGTSLPGDYKINQKSLQGPETVSSERAPGRRRQHNAEPDNMRHLFSSNKSRGINRVGDSYEREADRLADRVMRMVVPEGSTIEDEVKRKPTTRSTDSSKVSLQLGLNSDGQPLSTSEKQFCEPRFGTDFSSVRFHTGADAAKTADNIDARAFTMRNDIAFSQGQYAPGSASGKRLIAHELTHVVQQRANKNSVAHTFLVQRAPAPCPMPETDDYVNLFNCNLDQPCHELENVYRVIDDNAVIRDEAMKPIKKKENIIPFNTLVSLVRYSTKKNSYVLVEDRCGNKIGWTWIGNLRSEQKRLRLAAIEKKLPVLKADVQRVYKSLINQSGKRQVVFAHVLMVLVEAFSYRWMKYVETGEVLDLRYCVGKVKTMKRGEIYVPHQMISTIRPFIEILESDIPGVSQLSGSKQVTGGSRYLKSTDWNSRLGVPQYRSQTDNIFHQSGTCNVTSFAMAAERLGYSRQDVLTAITNKYNNLENKFNKFRDSKLWGNPNSEIPKVEWNDFKAHGQMEELIHFILYFENINRLELNANDNAEKVLSIIDPERKKGTPAPERIDSNKKKWPVIKTKIKDCLDDGGAVILSFIHKPNGSHIISVQTVTSTGVIVDDPYGKIYPDYLKGDSHAYRADEAKRNKVPPLTDNKWYEESAQFLDDEYSYGESYEISDKTMTSAWFYALLIPRTRQTKP